MLDALTLDQMRTFVAVAEAGSFRAAAGRLSRVQSAVSHAIAGLEVQVGVTLFDRSGRRPTLTPEGQALLADARGILLKVDTMRARARGLGEGLELSLGIALDPQFPLGVAAAALKDLHDTYPSVSVWMWAAPLGAAIVALREGRCALAITAADIPDPRVELEALTFVPRAAVAAPRHPLAVCSAQGEPLAAAELADHLQIVVPDPSLLTAGRDFGVLSPGTWHVSDNETKRALILAGVGWGSLPLWLVERDLAEGRLVRIAAAAFGPDGETVVRAYLAHRTDQPLGPAARRLRQALLRRADEAVTRVRGRRTPPCRPGDDGSDRHVPNGGAPSLDRPRTSASGRAKPMSFPGSCRFRRSGPSGSAMTSEIILELRAAITRSFPELSGAHFTPIASWDSVAVDVDDRLIFKFPRHAAAEKALVTEASLLTVVRPAVTMPDLILCAGPPLFSRHVKLKGEHLLTRHYASLPDGARQGLASDLALFFAELHRLDPQEMQTAGAGPIKPWPQPEDILGRTWPLLPPRLRRYADQAVAAWQQLAPDPHGTTYGFFDGHGWNMAFDHARQQLNGIYDFADSGFGPLHQEFIYSNWIAPDLTARLIAEYEALTGRALDRQRIDLLSGVLRLSELAEHADDAEHALAMVKNVADWAAR